MFPSPREARVNSARARLCAPAWPRACLSLSGTWSAPCRGSIPALCPCPRLPASPSFISSYLLPASSCAVCLFLALSDSAGPRSPFPGPLLSLLPTPPALKSPSVTGCVRAPVSPPRVGPHTPPTSWRCRGRRLREGTGWGRRHPPPDVGGALGWGTGQLLGHPLPPPLAPACRVPGRMGCTVSLVCCEALEPGPPSSPQPPGSPPAPARAQCWEPRASAHAESRRLLLQVGRCGDGCGERVVAKQSSPEIGKEPGQESARQALGGGQQGQAAPGARVGLGPAEGTELG